MLDHVGRQGAVARPAHIGAERRHHLRDRKVRRSGALCSVADGCEWRIAGDPCQQQPPDRINQLRRLERVAGAEIMRASYAIVAIVALAPPLLIHLRLLCGD